MTARDVEPEGTTDLVLVRATPDDAAAVAALHLTAREAAVPAIPPSPHPPGSALGHFAGRLTDPACEVWLARDAAGELTAYLMLTHAWLDDLYVVPDRTGQGIGGALLGLARQLRPDGFSLWVFASNHRARRFYARHGLVEVEHTDGSANDEQAPDIRMVWPGADPTRTLRRMLDDVDGRLGALLQHRAALTAAVQRHKPVAGHPGRDRGREQEIAARMAAMPGPLAADAFGRILDAVITASLDAVPREDP